MRIVAGDLKGRPIAAPKGKATRPTSDRARETLFNILMHADFSPLLQGARVIDLFAGSGALGLEAISRGAEFGLFVETASPARAAIKANIDALQLSNTAQLFRRGATNLGQRSGGLGAPFDIAFLDPPYGQGLINPCLRSLTDGGWMHEKALIIAESAQDECLTNAAWTTVKERTIGAAKFWFLKRN